MKWGVDKKGWGDGEWRVSTEEKSGEGRKQEMKENRGKRTTSYGK